MRGGAILASAVRLSVLGALAAVLVQAAWPTPASPGAVRSSSLTDARGSLPVRAGDLVLPDDDPVFAAHYRIAAHRPVAASEGVMTGTMVRYERTLLTEGGPELIMVTTTVSPSIRYAELFLLGRRTALETSVYEEGDLWGIPDPESTLVRANVGQERFSFRLPGLDGATDGIVLMLRQANVVFEIVMFGPRAEVDVDRAALIARASLARLASVAQLPLSIVEASRPEPTPDPQGTRVRSR